MWISANRIRAVGDIAVLASFAALSLLPLAMGSDTADEAAEGRKLASWPARPETFSQLEKWPDAYEKWFADHFGGRNQLLWLNTRIALDVFGVSPTDQVVLGTDGWLYFTHEALFADRRGEVRLTWEELERWRTVLEGRRAWLAARGVPYVFVVPANKVTVYPEHLPARHRHHPPLPTRMDQITAHLREHSKFPLVDLRPLLIEASKSQQVYHATDSHWNEIGGDLGYRAVVAALQEQGLAIEPLPLALFEKHTAPRRGDLVRFIPQSGIPDETAWFLTPRQPLPVRKVPLPQGWDHPPPEWGVWTTPTVYESDTGSGTLLVIGDSFQWQMMPQLASHFRRTVCVSAPLMDFQVLEALCLVVKPTVLLEQRVERNMRWVPRPHPAR